MEYVKSYVLWVSRWIVVVFLVSIVAGIAGVSL